MDVMLILLKIWYSGSLILWTHCPYGQMKLYKKVTVVKIIIFINLDEVFKSNG